MEGTLKNITFTQKLLRLFFGQLFEKLGFLLFQHLVTLLVRLRVAELSSNLRSLNSATGFDSQSRKWMQYNIART